MNRSNYGYPLPPNYATRVAPPRWTNARAYTRAGTYTDFVVPANVFQIGLMVVGAGGSGAMATPNNGYVATGGGGGGFAFGILDVTPGQVLPTITVGAGGAALITVSGVNGNAGGTSSFGTIVTCTGGGGGNTSAVKTDAAGGVGGTATVTGLRNSVASTGGRGGNITSTSANYKVTGGGAPGGFFNSGNGGDIVAVTGAHDSHATGGAGWGGNGSGLNPSVPGSTNGMAYGGGAFNFNGASIIPFPAGTQTFVASSGTGTAGVGYFSASPGATLGGNGIIGAPTQPLVPVAVAQPFTIQPAAGSGLLSSNASNPYLLLVDLNFGGAGGNSFVNGSATNTIYAAGPGGNGGGGGGMANGTSSGSFIAGDGGVAGGGGGLSMGIATLFLKAGSGGFFGGGGALSSNNTSNYAIAGSGGNGGGGGGISTGTTATRLSGAGGDGAVILYWTDGY